MRRLVLGLFVALSACAANVVDPADQSSEAIDEGPVTVVARASTADEYAFALEASAASDTSWAEAGNEAIVLEVLRGSNLVGHLVLHHGNERFTYRMHVGALAVGETIGVRVSGLSAKSATKSVRITSAALTSATALGAAGEGLRHAPVFKWPVKKAFDDAPMILGWSASRKSYEIVYTNENGGTCAICGGGARGMRTEIGRWGRGSDIEGIYSYGSGPRFERCTGTTDGASHGLRMQADHPVLYYGDGHNRVFESRGGYGQTCGTGAPEKADGDIAGWNVKNPNDQAAYDAPFTIVFRPLPVDLDAAHGREALANTYAPWVYRLTSDELAREGKIDHKDVLSMERYLYVDVGAADVNGAGDPWCAVGGVSGGFVLRAKDGSGTTSSAMQMTSDYFGGDPAIKRLAIPLAAAYRATDVKTIVFDAYDNDGIYWLTLGDAFIARPVGRHGAELDYVHKGVANVGAYVDDDRSGCVNGENTRNGVPYPCVGSFATFNVN